VLIYAEPMTITGRSASSTGKFDLSGLLRKLGVTTIRTSAANAPDLEACFRAYNDEERAVLLDKLRYMYGRSSARSRGPRHEEGRSRRRLAAVTCGPASSQADQARGSVRGLGDALVEAKQACTSIRIPKVQLFDCRTRRRACSASSGIYWAYAHRTRA